MTDTDSKKEPKILLPGALLKEARESTSLSVEQIAARMNLTQEVVQELEADKYQKSLSPAFYRGYLRTYAQIVDLDADDLIKLFNKAIDQDSLSNSITPTFDTNLRAQKNTKIPFLKWFGWLVLLFLLGGAGYYLWTLKIDINDDSSLEIPLENLEAIEEESSEILLNLTLDPEPESSAEQGKLQSNSEIISNQLDEEDIDDPIAEHSPELIELRAKLLMDFTGDCWVKVTDKSGEVLAIGIKRAGKLMELEGEAPFDIVLGNAAVVSLKYNQQQVDLSSFPPGNRVKMSLSANSEFLR